MSHEQIKSVKSQLALRIGELVQSLFADKAIVKSHGGFRVGNKGSLVIQSDGLFCNHEAGLGGDVIDLIKHTLHCDFKAALHWANSFIGNAPVTIAKPAIIKQSPVINEGERIAKALRLWRAAKPLQGTLAEKYLHNRGLNLPLPDSLRFLPNAWNHTTDKHHPALVAAGQNCDGKISFVHLVYLTPEGKKISGDKVEAKLSFGIMKGCAVQLSPLSESLVLCEGLEDGLSILQAMPQAAVWAGIGTGNLIKMPIPDTVTDIVIAADNDVAGIKAARKLAERLIALGKVVRLAKPQAAKDFNEILTREGQ